MSITVTILLALQCFTHLYWSVFPTLTGNIHSSIISIIVVKHSQLEFSMLGYHLISYVLLMW